MTICSQRLRNPRKRIRPTLLCLYAVLVAISIFCGTKLLRESLELKERNPPQQISNIFDLVFGAKKQIGSKKNAPKNNFEPILSKWKTQIHNFYKKGKQFSIFDDNLRTNFSNFYYFEKFNKNWIEELIRLFTRKKIAYKNKNIGLTLKSRREKYKIYFKIPRHITLMNINRFIVLYTVKTPNFNSYWLNFEKFCLDLHHFFLDRISLKNILKNETNNLQDNRFKTPFSRNLKMALKGAKKKLEECNKIYSLIPYKTFKIKTRQHSRRKRAALNRDHKNVLEDHFEDELNATNPQNEKTLDQSLNNEKKLILDELQPGPTRVPKSRYTFKSMLSLLDERKEAKSNQKSLSGNNSSSNDVKTITINFSTPTKTEIFQEFDETTSFSSVTYGAVTNKAVDVFAKVNASEHFWAQMKELLSHKESQNKALTPTWPRAKQKEPSPFTSAFHPSQCYTPSPCKQDPQVNVNTNSPKR